jgi:hypothetical protein
MDLDDIMSMSATAFLVFYFAITASYWADILYLLSVDPFIVFSIWLETGGVLP